MDVFEQENFSDHEHVSFFFDKETGLKAIIAVHSTKLGVAGGGTRFFPYENSEDALVDALRLSRAMSYKNALAGLPYGGGKSVIIGDHRTMKNEALLEAFGRCVDRLGGRYVCAEDIGMTPDDMAIINRSTPYVVGLPGKSGDTSPPTGYGLYKAMRAAADFRLGGNLSSVAILGFGNVGRNLANNLVKQDVALFVADINRDNVKLAVEKYGAKEVGLDEIYDLDVDIFAPCALGGVLNDQTIPRLRAKVVCGAANNQLLDTQKHGKMLGDRGILYVPDYIANAGGVISASAEVGTFTETQVETKIENIYHTCTDVFRRSQEQGCTPIEAAEEIGRQMLA
ncbi:MAG: Glu/Leu/Phe/Val dehydrogenase dimerization domain-containing protein [Halieaceae bacterium]|nr:Glu/Leu/Phe/Val dehydrogenase dimerization domain-containing protein [Halieaceae bacterium]